MKFLLPAIGLFLITLFPLTAFSQTPNDTDDVVKITTKLVQVDVVVTDKSGQQVLDLKAADFELTQDGKRQQITAATYVASRSGAGSNVVNDLRTSGKNASGPAATRNANSTGRVIAFLVDDGACTATVWGLDTAKKAVSTFVREKMQPDDLVALYRTRAGSSAFQQYTSDKATLLRATDKIRWYPPQGACSVSDGSGTEAARANTFNKVTSEGVKTVTIESEAEKRTREYNEDWNASNQIVGTLGVMRYALTGMARAPGRKTMFVLSDGIAIRNRQNLRVTAQDIMRDVTEAANRAAVVIHTFDLRAGGNPGMIEAKDEVIVQDNFNATDPISRGRIGDSDRLQEGLTVLAKETGGELYRGSDGAENRMDLILDRESGYYLLAYEPDDSSFKGKNFNKIDVKVTRPEVNVRHRSGFLGMADNEASKPVRKSEYSELYEAIAAPLPK
ncbi:MAG: VWA domain-containing protein, partial [Pyrinomonadaceae bacterium]